MNITNFSFNELTKTDTAYDNIPNDLNIIKKYEDMLDSADAITYATDEDFFYTAQ